MKINQEFKDLIPPLSEDEYNQLEKNCITEGIRDSLVTWQGTLIDGHNRYEIATKHNLHYTTIEKEFDNENDVIEWIIYNQFGRRNLSNYQRSVLALRLEPIFQEKAKENSVQSGKEYGKGLSILTNPINKINTREEIRKIAGVSSGTMAKVQKIEKEATPETKQKLLIGDISIDEAYKDIKKENAKIARTEYIEKQKQDIEAGTHTLPAGKFEVICIDPPWNYKTQYDAGGRRVANPYPEMTQEELKQLIIPASDDCIMFLWTTHKFIFDAKELLDYWGFNYRNILVWNKEQIGMGDLFRMQCEFCLIGIKGKPVFNNNHTHRDIFTETRREHSRKPQKFYDMIEKLCIGRKLDYFSRENKKGWEVYGNETSKFTMEG
jgi:N6-adenosine-specific RNA methylase IME4